MLSIRSEVDELLAELDNEELFSVSGGALAHQEHPDHDRADIQQASPSSRSSFSTSDNTSKGGSDSTSEGGTGNGSGGGSEGGSGDGSGGGSSNTFSTPLRLSSLDAGWASWSGSNEALGYEQHQRNKRRFVRKQTTLDHLLSELSAASNLTAQVEDIESPLASPMASRYLPFLNNSTPVRTPLLPCLQPSPLQQALISLSVMACEQLRAALHAFETRLHVSHTFRSSYSVPTYHPHSRSHARKRL